MIQFLFWDIDNTIFDFEWAENAGLHEAYASNGAPLTDEMFLEYRTYNRELWDKLEQGQITRDFLFHERHRHMVEHYHLAADPDSIEIAYRENLSNRFKFMPYAEETIRSLAKKYRMFIASNGVIQTQYRRLKDAGIWDLFEAVFVSESVGYEKPDKAFFDTAAAQIPGYHPGNAVIIGDSPGSDIAGGRTAGMQTIWYNFSNQPVPERCRPDYIINDLRELISLLSRINAGDNHA